MQNKYLKQQEERIGEVYTNPTGKSYKIIEYKNCHDVTVIFDNGEISEHLEYANVKRGAVALPSKAHERHGERYTKLWKEWNTMLWRCNPKNKRHHIWYSDKGVTVCDEWHIFSNFKKWAINNGFSEDLTIDRIDSSIGYCPENCQWITLSENVSKANKGRKKKSNEKME